jgi:hypothetical protein
MLLRPSADINLPFQFYGTFIGLFIGLIFGLFYYQYYRRPYYWFFTLGMGVATSALSLKILKSLFGLGFENIFTVVLQLFFCALPTWGLNYWFKKLHRRHTKKKRKMRRNTKPEDLFATPPLSEHKTSSAH